MYRWHIRFYGPYRYGRFEHSRARLWHDGFTELQLVRSCRDRWGNKETYYTTTHKSRSAMMMYMLKHTDDGINIEVIKEFHDV
jgi:hypothetical protein